MIPIISDVYENEQFVAARKMLVVLSVLFLAINVSVAKLLEANTFIFKVSFENSYGLNVILFFGVIILTVRYYSVANVYHRAAFKLWSDSMLSDSRMLLCFRSSNSLNGPAEKGEVLADGFLARHPYIKEIAINHLMITPRPVEFTYQSRGLLERHLYYYPSDNQGVPVIIKLEEKVTGWTRKDFYRLLLLESKYQILCAFKRHEFLEIRLPYFLALISIIYFLSTEQVSLFLASKIVIVLNFIDSLSFFLK